MPVWLPPMPTDPAGTRMRGVEASLPSIREVIDLTIRCGRLTNPAIRAVGIAVNTESLSEPQARTLLQEAEAALDFHSRLRIQDQHRTARLTAGTEYGSPKALGNEARGALGYKHHRLRIRFSYNTRGGRHPGLLDRTPP